VDFCDHGGPCCQQVGRPGCWLPRVNFLHLPRCRHSDVTGERFFHILIPLCIGIVGFIIAISTMRLAARYIALYVYCLSVQFDGHLTVISFLMAQSYSGFICFLAWTSNIFDRSPSKRAVALAFINAFSQLGNFASSWVSCVVCCPTFTAFGINFIRIGICGKSPGVRHMPIRTRFAFRRMCSALPCASSSGRCSPKRTKICRRASPREAEGTDIYFRKYHGLPLLNAGRNRTAAEMFS
jgi:hypothetical protein